VAAGAIRSRMLADAMINPADFADSEKPMDGPIGSCLGTAQKPGSFRLVRFVLARKREESVAEPLLPLPADWVVTEDTETKTLELHRLRPQKLPEGVVSSAALSFLPRMRIGKEKKARSGLFLTGEGLSAWIRDDKLETKHLVDREKLWKTDSRLGIAMDVSKRTAAQGRIYTSEAVQLADDIGFVAEVTGANGLLPQSGLVRLGGDGRGAEVMPVAVAWPEPDWDAIVATGRFRLMLTSPAVFEEGWRPTLKGARLVAASVGRAEVVSGWDLAAHAPKPALRAAPAGSVYWYEDFRGDVAELKALVREGIGGADEVRRAEGFNSCLIGNWKEEEGDV